MKFFFEVKKVEKRSELDLCDRVILHESKISKFYDDRSFVNVSLFSILSLKGTSQFFIICEIEI